MGRTSGVGEGVGGGEGVGLGDGEADARDAVGVGVGELTAAGWHAASNTTTTSKTRAITF